MTGTGRYPAVEYRRRRNSAALYEATIAQFTLHIENWCAKEIFMAKRQTIRIVLAGAGLIALAGGILQGGYRDTLMKAVHICMECIGIG